MTLTLKKALTVAAITLTLGAIAVLTGFLVSTRQAEAQTAGSAFATEVRSFPNNNPATTTRAGLLSTGFTAAQSFIVPTEDVDLLELRLMAEASTTATAFRWRVSYSDNYNVSTGNGDWYYRDNTSVAIASTTHSVQPHEDEWIPGTVATSSKAALIYPIQADFTRIQFYATGAAGSLHADAVIRKELAR